MTVRNYAVLYLNGRRTRSGVVVGGGGVITEGGNGVLDTAQHAITGSEHTAFSGLAADALRGDRTWIAAAPATADYLVGTAQAGLSAEIVVGATPGGELGGTWAAPTVDATHSGSAHIALGSTGSTAAAGDHTHASSGGATPLLADDASSPFVFDDLLQNDLGTAWLFPDA